MIRSKDINDYFQASFELIKPDKEITFGLYLYFRENRHVMQWQRSGERPNVEWLDKYKGRGILRVWIHNDDAPAWEAYLSPEELARHRADQAVFAAEEEKLAAEAQAAAPQGASSAGDEAEAAAGAVAEAGASSQEKAEADGAVAGASKTESQDDSEEVSAKTEGDEPSKKDTEAQEALDGDASQEIAAASAAGETTADDSLPDVADSDDEDDGDARKKKSEDEDAASEDAAALKVKERRNRKKGADGEDEATLADEASPGEKDEAASADDASADGSADAKEELAADEAVAKLDENGLPIVEDLDLEGVEAEDGLSLDDKDPADEDDERSNEQEDEADWGSQLDEGEQAPAWVKRKAQEDAAKARQPQDREKKEKEITAKLYADEKANQRLADAIKKAREKRKQAQEIKTEAGKKLWDLLNNSKLGEQEKKEAVAAEARSLLAQTAAKDQTDPQAARQEARQAVEDVLKDALKEAGSLLSELWELSNLDPDLTHGANVATYASILAMAFGRVDPQLIADLALAGLTHDLGMTQVPVHLSKKAWTAHSAPERKSYGSHVDASLALLQKHGSRAGAAGAASQRSLEIIHQHHEKFDGSGYPQKLQGFKVDDVAQLLAIADLIESVSSGRYDGQERTLEGALSFIEKIEKSKTFPEYFNPDVFAAVMRFIHAPATDAGKDSAMAIMKAQTKSLLKAS